MSSIGSPKKRSPPCASMPSRLRWMAPIDAAETLLEHGAQVAQIQQQQAVVVGDAKHQLQHAFLGVVEIEHPCQKRRPQVRDGRAQGVALLAEDIPQRHRTAPPGRRRLAHGGQALGDLRVAAAGLGQAGQVALDVGHEHRHADVRELLRHGLQRDGLAGAGRTGHEAVAVGQLRQEEAFRRVVAGYQERVGHACSGRVQTGKSSQRSLL
jgi:hypothetical protein